MAEITITHNGNTLWTKTLNAADINAIRDQYADPIAGFSAWLEQSVEKRLKVLKRQMAQEAFGAGLVDLDATVDAIAADPAYENKAEREAD